MITPYFTINQDDEFVYIDIKITHIRFSAPNIEMIVENELFIFSLPPYYLRLRFPYPCIDDERAHSEYDSKSESVKIKIPKANKGQFFPDLDLTAKLLARSGNDEIRSAEPKKPLIEELDVNNDDIINRQAERDLNEGETFNWEVEQDLPKNPILGSNDQDDNNLKPKLKYGFDNQYEGIVGVSVSNGNDINGLNNPEQTPENDRIIERLIKENIQFDPEIYAADYIMEKYPTPDDDKSFKEIIEWNNPEILKFLKWYKSQQHLEEKDRQSIMPVEFTKKEQEQMINLPRKSYLVDETYKPQILATVISLLFAYHFDLRETEGEHNVESAWTIGKITPQFSYLDSKLSLNANDNLLRSAVITCIRRALTFPLHRSYKLCEKVWNDVYFSLRGGKRLILQFLLDLKELFRYHDIYYVYDKIWIEDLCSYLISDNVTESIIRSIAHDLKKVLDELKKSDITFEKVDEEEIQIDREGKKEQEEQEDEMIVLSLEDIEEMAETSYRDYQSQK
ncbi:uncharacterized protein KGF55_001757 [Candida pseudojiufengensis]|uniref:uncharacterized protein n=1 Tax=Candida pseudojiufengensis TaxID=497109 RepID=UPI0022257444|nr:uncharacterized protein KGF55_001757 [Candida pseudojiufengensis]KAI5964688.1 hypothetical protein KGF55_001757 [Candida pseudojiufengensis]